MYQNLWKYMEIHRKLSSIGWHMYTTPPRYQRNVARMAKKAKEDGALASHVARVNESCHMCAWVVSRVRVSFAEYRLFYRALLQKRAVVLSHVCMSRVTCADESCPIGSLLQKSPIKERLYCAKETYNLIDPTHESCPICEWVVSHVRMSRVTYIYESWCV